MCWHATLFVGGALAWFISRPKPVAGTTTLTADAKAYVRNLQLADVSMKPPKAMSDRR